MFDKLVESTRQQKKGRSKFFVATSLIYGFSLSALGVLSILWFNPAPVEAYNNMGLIAPPLVPSAPPPPSLIRTVSRPTPNYAPTTPPATIADPKTVTPALRVNRPGTVIPGAEYFNNDSAVGIPNPLAGGDKTGEAPPPPAPTPLPTPKITPTPAPTPEAPKIVPMTSVMIAGKAIKRVQPPYPQIAKSIRAQGAVPVQILISEDGRVLDATVVGGHPTLRDAARLAAKEWMFSPTILNGKGVKVSGILTFNFTLN